MQWRKIETAPKNGTPIMVVGGNFESAGSCNIPMTVKWFSFIDDKDGNWVSVHYCYEWATALNPTHWMPLPELPKGGSDE